MSNDVVVTVVGWVATSPVQADPDSTHPYTHFRLASTPRYRKDGQWTDRPTEWFTVKAWRDAALNIALSVHKGEPVVVQGRLRSQEWESAEGPRTELVIEAMAVGHDLMRGRASFARVVRSAPPAESAVGPEGADHGSPVGAEDGLEHEDAVLVGVGG